MIMHPIAGGIIAARPWSWTAAVVPIILTGVLLKKESGISLLSYDFGAALAIGVLVQAAANLTNSYLDWKKGVDKKRNSWRQGYSGRLFSKTAQNIVEAPVPIQSVV
mmetsp:Transcript_22280/g.34980  ORF Transcript_22280/g.34980 Transcript_22280/m.34980 type:complete len:107 (-) Transcript_22280:730-1050(-)